MTLQLGQRGGLRGGAKRRVEAPVGGSSDPMREAGGPSTGESLGMDCKGCARPTGGSHGRTTDVPAQRFEGKKRRPRPRGVSKSAATSIIKASSLRTDTRQKEGRAARRRQSVDTYTKGRSRAENFSFVSRLRARERRRVCERSRPKTCAYVRETSPSASYGRPQKSAPRRRHPPEGARIP